MAVQLEVSKESVGVFLDISSGEQLKYRLTVRGATPIFRLVDSQTKRRLMSEQDAPVSTMPSVVFERRWPLPNDQRLQVSSHTMGLQFLGVISYRYEIEQIRANGDVELLLDITYTSNKPEDAFFQDLQVTTV